MFKNVAGQKIALFAFDSATGLPKTGDAANITAYVSKDNGPSGVLGDTTATEQSATLAPGWYEFDVAQAESNADVALFTGVSTTAGIVVVGRPVTLFPANMTTLKVSSTGYVSPTLGDMDVPVGNSAQALGVLWYGTLAAIASGSVTLPPGHNLDHMGNYALVLVSGGNAKGRARYLTYSGVGEVWNVDPAWDSDSETVPSGVLVAYIIPAPKLPTANLPQVTLSGDLTATMKTSVAVSVLDATASAHDVAGSVGEKISSAASAGDPWGADLSTYGAGTAGKTVHDNLDTPVSGLPAAVWAVLTASLVAAGSVGKRIADFVTGDAYALLTSAQAESAATPASNASPIVKLGWTFARLRNKTTFDGATQRLRNDSDTADMGTATVTDNGSGTSTRSKWT